LFYSSDLFWKSSNKETDLWPQFFSQSSTAEPKPGGILEVQAFVKHWFLLPILLRQEHKEKSLGRKYPEQHLNYVTYQKKPYHGHKV
jgi:hypothetical protein